MNIQLLLKWIPPIAIIIAGFLIGFILEKFIFRKLQQIPKRKKWKILDLITSSLRNLPILWFGLAGIFGAISFLPLEEASLKFINNVLMVIIIFTAVLVLARITSGMVRIQGRRTSIPSISLFANLTKITVFVLGILVILQTLGISITPILTALGVGGLAVALALQGTLSDLFAGLQIIASKQIRIGDYVQLDSGQEGYVTDITWKNTTIRGLPNNMIIIPNSKLASTILTNFNQPVREMSVLVQVGVHYDSDLEKVEGVTIEVAKQVMNEVEGGVSGFEPFIRYHTFDQSSINFTVILRSKEFVNKYIVKHEFIKRLKKRFNKENIVIPFPITTVQMSK